MKKLFKTYPILLIIFAFSPYILLNFGLKADDILIYPLAVLAMSIALLSKKIKVNKSVLGLFVVWTSVSFYLVIRTVIVGGQISTQSFIADINNFAQPVAILLLFLLIMANTTKEDTLKLIITSSKTLLLLLYLNAIWTILGFFFDLTYINTFFVGGVESTAANAAQNGRFSGIFNQPIEAGISYSVGLLVWLYLIENKHMKINIRSVLILLLLFIGGSLTVSKVFVILGLVMFFFGVITNRVVRKRIIQICLIFFALGYPAYLYLAKTWDGLNYLLRLFDTSNYQAQGFISMITAERYGSKDSQQSNYFNEILESSPIIGEGLGSQATYDSSHFYFFSTGGLIGLLGYVALIAVFLWLLYELYVYNKFGNEFKLFLGVFVLVVVGGLGGPTLTLNRASIIIWVFIGLILQYLCKVKTEKHKEKTEKLKAA